MSLLLQGAGSPGAFVWAPPSFPALSVSYSLGVFRRYEADSGLGLANNAPVTAWSDQATSSVGLTPYDINPGRPPTFKALGWDGIRPCVTFDGVLNLLSNSTAMSPPYSVFVVCRYNTSYTLDAAVFDGRGGYSVVQRNGASSMMAYAGTTAALTTTPQSPHLYVANFKSDTSISVDGGSFTTVAGSVSSGQNGVVLGGQHATLGAYANVDVAAVVVGNNLVAADITLVATYLRTKWATP